MRCRRPSSPLLRPSACFVDPCPQAVHADGFELGKVSIVQPYRAGLELLGGRLCGSASGWFVSHAAITAWSSQTVFRLFPVTSLSQNRQTLNHVRLPVSLFSTTEHP